MRTPAVKKLSPFFIIENLDQSVVVKKRGSGWLNETWEICRAVAIYILLDPDLKKKMSGEFEHWLDNDLKELLFVLFSFRYDDGIIILV